MKMRSEEGRETWQEVRNSMQIFGQVMHTVCHYSFYEVEITKKYEYFGGAKV